MLFKKKQKRQKEKKNQRRFTAVYCFGFFILIKNWQEKNFEGISSFGMVQIMWRNPKKEIEERIVEIWSQR